MEIKFYLSMCKIHDGRVILALQHFGHSGNLGKLDPNTPNSLGYIESITKSPTPHSATNVVFSLISIQPFQAINLIFAIHFSIWACALIKKQRICQLIKFVDQKKKLKTIVSSTPSFPRSKPLSQLYGLPPTPTEIYLDFSYNLNFKYDACEGVYLQ